MKKALQIATEDSVFELKPSETLLEGLERTGHQVEYQKPPLAYLRQNEILPCCCHALEALKVSVGLK